ncbi:MAG: response regulator [Aestuariivita sp.]|nr:response regulator [Aestuariivita sp.]MCY4345547.1 response regulator [Aestuariivita sp.]
MVGTVLLIEDEQNIMEAMRFLLSRDGWSVHTHGKGVNAVEKISQVGPDVVILDMMLPDCSGLEILKCLRGNSETKGLPVLMLTARGQQRDRKLAEKAGATRFMTKPFSNAELLQTVNDLANSAAKP